MHTTPSSQRQQLELAWMHRLAAVWSDRPDLFGWEAATAGPGTAGRQTGRQAQCALHREAPACHLLPQL